MSRRASVVLLLSLATSLSSFSPGLSLREPVQAIPEPVVLANDEDPLQLAVAARLTSRGTALGKDEVERVSAAIVAEAEAFGLAPSLVTAVIEVESGFDPFAVSRVGAMGLMQVIPSTGQALAEELGIDWRGPRTLFDPVANVRLGVAYLAKMRERFGHLPTALAAYNYGPSAIVRRVRAGSPVPKGYSRRVLSAKAEAPLLPVTSS
ncbi:MAG: transglycosylase SLT domain-containing protein [Myxococcota bacterium]|nr:transglycosylase SLT domain-containing protein [Myxococcota bacterium]